MQQNQNLLRVSHICDTAFTLIKENLYFWVYIDFKIRAIVEDIDMCL